MVSVLCSKNNLIVPGNHCSFPKALPVHFAFRFHEEQVWLFPFWVKKSRA